MIPSMVMFGLFDANRLFLNCLDETTVATILVIVALPMHGFLSYYIVHGLEMGWIGVNLSIFITYSFLFVFITLYSTYIKNTDVREAFHAPSMESFKEWWQIVELAVPSAFLYMVEWTACEGLILFSGLIGVTEQSTLGIILILMPIIMSFTFGM